LCHNKLINQFWKDTFKAWKIVADSLITINNHLYTPIWYNEKVKIDNKTMFYVNWYQNGVRFICDLITYDKHFYELDEFRNKYNITQNS